MSYDRIRGVAYAHRWAFDRNPHYYNFDGLGGDCTNFISQCLYAASSVMNETPVTGWYYRSLNDRSAAWSGVPYLYNFLTSNTGPGPYGHEAPMKEAIPGDVVQLSFDGQIFGHSLYVVQAGSGDILITTHTFNADNRPLDSYTYTCARLIHIDGSRGG